MQTVETSMGDGEYDLEEAIKQAIRQRKYMIEQLIMEREGDDDYHDESDDDL